MTLHVAWTGYSEVKALRVHCHTCRPFRVAAVGAFQEWYGWFITCLRCGDQWEEGERLPRPCRRGWRREHIQAARDRYRAYHPKPARPRGDHS